MPRAGRTFEEGRIYHVYNRVGGGWMAFGDEKLGERFIEIFRQVVDRDEATSFGWCLLGNHYHLILRQVPLAGEVQGKGGLGRPPPHAARRVCSSQPGQGRSRRDP